MDVVKHLIICLEELKEKESPLLSHILDYELLISSLEELDNMVEMCDVKNSIVSQIKFLLVNTVDQDSGRGNFDDHMLHTVLCGPPGCGKSKMGVILAKIWTSLGLLKKKEKKNQKHEIKELKKHIKNLALSSEIKGETVKKLQDNILEIKNELSSNDYKLNLFRIRSLKRELEKMKNKDFSYITCMKLIDEVKRDAEIFRLKTEKILCPKEEEDIQFTIPILRGFTGENIYNFDKIIKEIKLPVIPVSSESPELKEDEELIRIVSREDFVAGFLGQTAIKTEKLLQESLGKVLFIDEAYSLINDEKDAYGYECLTTLNRFMSEHSSEIVIIFAGYKDLLEKTIFKAQPGLKRRCTWHFEITGYTEKGLSQIFESQLENNGWLLDTDVNIRDFFKTNLKEFPYFGGDTLKLVFYCKICYSKEVFDNRHENNKVVNQKILEEALSYLKNYRISEVESKSPRGMYL